MNLVADARRVPDFAFIWLGRQRRFRHNRHSIE
jgi:hypothetical protein